MFSHLGRWLRRPSPELLATPLFLVQVDRLVVTSNAVLIVDFKTNRDPPTTPNDIPPGYIRQMAMYSAVLSRVFPDHAIRGALLWTDGPHLMPIPDALLHPDTP